MITAIIVILTSYLSGTAAVEVTVVVVISLLALPVANIIQKGMAQMLLVMGKPTDQDTRAERAVKKVLRVFTLGGKIFAPSFKSFGFSALRPCPPRHTPTPHTALAHRLCGGTES